MSSTLGSISFTCEVNSSGTDLGRGVVPRMPSRTPALSPPASVLSLLSSCALLPPSPSSPQAAARMARTPSTAKRRQSWERLVIGSLLLPGRRGDRRRRPGRLCGTAWQTAGVGLPELRARLAGLDRVVVAFSGGADSALLAFTAADVLGERALAVTAVSPSLAPEEEAD